MKLIEIKRQLSEYPLYNQYNMNETALFYKMPSDSTIAWNTVEGNKKDKTHITIALTCNAKSTDWFELIFIRYTKRSCSFNKKTSEELGFFYYYNKRAWMTEVLFQEYLKRFNRHISHPVILVIDNTTSHVWENLQRRNIKVISLPPNTILKL